MKSKTSLKRNHLEEKRISSFDTNRSTQGQDHGATTLTLCDKTPFFILPISLAIDGIQVYSISIIVYNRRATVMHVSNIYRFITSDKAMTSLSCQWPYPGHTECGLVFESFLNFGCCVVISFNDSL